MAKFKTDEDKKAYWHASSHILADAVKRIFPDVKLGIGPAIDQGFYYDFQKEEGFSKEDLAKIEKEANKIIKENKKFELVKMPKPEAKKFLKEEPFKLDLLKDITDQNVTFYKHGDFTDLCAGPLVESTNEIGIIKLLDTSSAYWKGNAKNASMQRIYGISFPDKKMLKKFLQLREEAIKKDHSVLGRHLDLYMTHPAVGKGLPLFKPKGATILRILKRWIEDEEIKRGYHHTQTPAMAKTDLFKISGHLPHYRKDMFVFKVENEDVELALRPMTCPFQFLIYGNKSRSYKDLPLRYAETAQLYRREQSGELHGLTRVWGFCLADAHILCTPEQLADEFLAALNLIKDINEKLGIKDYWYQFSKWDPSNKEKYIDNPAAWDSTQTLMKKILDENNLKYVEKEGEAAFYGPKLDIQMKNVWGKEDTIFTVQIDFAGAERFGLTYVDEKGNKERPMIIHRSSIGAYERVLATLIEHYAGAFPLWLAPVQLKVISFTDRNQEASQKIVDQLKKEGFRVEADFRTESVQKKVREGELEKLPYILVIGDKEEENQTVAVRPRGQKPKFGVKLEEFIKDLKQQVKDFK